MNVRPVSRTMGLSPDEAAAHWLIRCDQGDLTPEEQAEFEGWRAEPVNADAFDRATGAWSLFDDAVGDPHLDALRQSALQMTPEPRRHWGLPAGGAVAAAVAALALVFTGQLSGPSVQREIASNATSDQAATVVSQDYVTRKGERRTLTLPDGSTVTLNTDSAVSIAYGAERRLIALSRGQALFEVAKDARRPFVVEAAGRRITALGTIFEVRLDPDRMKVLLVEGRVVIDKAGDARTAAAAAPVTLEPNQALVAELGSPQLVKLTDVNTELLWRDGYVEFNNTPLPVAIAEINRYTQRPVVVTDPNAAVLRLSGVFKTGDPERFAANLREILPVTIRSRDDRIEIGASGATGH